jgi:hypothetical protein
MKIPLSVLSGILLCAIWFAWGSSASAVTISPSSVTLKEGATQQFKASVSSIWKTTCGTISSSGLYKASLYEGTCTVTATAGSQQATAKVMVKTPIVMTPRTIQTQQGKTQQFTASIPVTWHTKCGSISASGLYTASGSVGQQCSIWAIAASGPAYTVYGWDRITPPPFSVSPTTARLLEHATQQFTASAPSTWKASCGSINAFGLYKAGIYEGNCTVTATAKSGGQQATAAVTTTSPIVMRPVHAKTAQGAKQQFTASVPVVWNANCGKINAAGLYTASAAVGQTCTIWATASSGPPYHVYGGDRILPPITSSELTISPATLHTHAIGKQHFTANLPVKWSSTCGSIDDDGNFTAPATAVEDCTVTAKASSGPAATARAAVRVTVVNYTTWKNDISRDGLQADEQILTPHNVNSTNFGPVWNKTLDGAMWDQLLYMNGLTIDGTPRNVLFVGTSNDSLYALDGDTGAQLWKASLLPSGATAVPGSSVGFESQIGILGTPVIDPEANTIYAVTETAEDNGKLFVHRLHAVDLANGRERPGSPVVISDPALVPVHKLQRPGLLLANHHVYVAFGSINDLAPYHGLLFAFDAGTLEQTAAFNVTPGGFEGAIWTSGAAPGADSDGNVYVATGNGSFDGKTNFGESVVKLSPALKPLDFFTPFDWKYDIGPADLDLGAGGLLFTPPQKGTYTHEIITCGKATPIFVLNRDSLGHVGEKTDNIPQRLDKQLGTGTNEPCFATPAMWQQHVYFVANSDVMKRFDLNPTTGLLSTTPVAKGAHKYAYPGAQPVVSSSGNQQGIIWTSEFGSGRLWANDAVTLKQLYQSPTQDTGVKFTVPTVVNGHVYVGYKTKIVAFSTHER